MTTSTTRVLRGVFHDKGGAVFNVKHKDFGSGGAKLDGTTDDTAAFEDAIDAANANGGIVTIPQSAAPALITAALPPVSSHGVRIVGASGRKSRIRFNPSSAGQVCLDFIGASSAVTLNRCGAEHLTIESTNTVQKTAYRWTDVSEFHLKHAHVDISFVGNGTNYSIGMESRGREYVNIERCVVYADKPLILSQNPRDLVTLIDIDWLTVEKSAFVPTLVASVAGSGTVSAASGTATFSSSQAGVVSAGGSIVVGGQRYDVLTFNGTTSATIKNATTFSTTSTFGAAAFTAILGAPNYCVTINPNLRSAQQISFEKILFAQGAGAVSWAGAGATQDCVGFTLEKCRYEQNQNSLGYFVNLNRSASLNYGVRIVGCSPSFTQNGVLLRRASLPTIESYQWPSVDPTLRCIDVDSTVAKLGLRKFWTQAGAGYSLSGQSLVWSSGRATGVDYAIPPSADYDNVAGDFAVGAMLSLRVNGPIGQEIAPTNEFGFYSNRVVPAAGGSAEMMRLIPTLTANANGDTLTGINLGPTYNINGKTGVTLRGIRISNVAGGATNYAIFTGTGIVSFGDLLLTIASAVGTAGLRLPHGAAPTSPVNGDVWTTTAGLFVRINGATVGPLT